MHMQQDKIKPEIIICPNCNKQSSDYLKYFGTDVCKDCWQDLTGMIL